MVLATQKEGSIFFLLFRGISEVRMELMGEEIVKGTNLREVPRKILSLMGKERKKYYN